MTSLARSQEMMLPIDCNQAPPGLFHFFFVQSLCPVSETFSYNFEYANFLLHLERCIKQM